MSSEALAVVTGVVCGVVAGIPLSLLALMLAKSRQVAQERGSPWQAAGGWQSGYPPVIVVQGGAPVPGQMEHLQPVLLPSHQRPARQFHLVGQDDEW